MFNYQEVSNVYNVLLYLEPTSMKLMAVDYMVLCNNVYMCIIKYNNRELIIVGIDEENYSFPKTHAHKDNLVTCLPAI